jgi:geranylgeranyl diphosphate synthase, type II
MLSSTTSHSAFDFKSYLSDRRDLVEKKLDELLEEREPKLLWESMRYSALGSGKRIRALLAISAYETIRRINSDTSKNNGKINQNSQLDRSDSQINLAKSLAPVLPLSCAIEMVHAMSLIHDDLPCLDNDDVRRGKPTNHKAYGEAMALLAGDALLMRAVEILICSTDIQEHIECQSILLDITGALATATGASGMVGGQVFDLIYTGHGPSLDRSSEDQVREKQSTSGSQVDQSIVSSRSNSKSDTSSSELNETVIRKIHAGKTGALLRFSLWSGARLASASQSQLKAMEQFGDIVGLAFQITDDLLDVTGDVATLGKTPGKDQAANKATWVAVFGVDGAREKLQILEDEGKSLLKAEGLSNSDGPILESLLEMAIHRHK